MYINSIIPWVGGKRALKDYIIPSFPLRYEIYAEVFGGGAAILFAKHRPGIFEVYNDFNSDLVNLFLCVRDHPIEFCNEAGFLPITCPEEFKILRHIIQHKPVDNLVQRESELAERLFKTPQKEEIQEILREKAEKGDIRRAVTFYKLLYLSYGSRGKSFTYQPFNIYSTLTNIAAASRRLGNVLILNRDFEFIIKKYDSPNTFFYLDPPYFQTEKMYTAIFTREDHSRLRDLLSQIQGRFLLSYNDCDHIKELYHNFFIAEVRRLDNMALHVHAGQMFKELLIANYDVNERRKSKPSQLSIFKEDGEIYESEYLTDFREERQNNHSVPDPDNTAPETK